MKKLIFGLAIAAAGAAFVPQKYCKTIIKAHEQQLLSIMRGHGLIA